MHWLKQNLRITALIIASALFLIVTLAWIAVSPASAHGEPSSITVLGKVTVESTPTEDATVTALNKEKLAQEVRQLQEQNEPDFLAWLRTNASLFVTTFLIIGGGIFGLLRYLAERRDLQKRLLDDRQAEREKQAEERFQSVVEGLGSDREEAKIGAAITLRAFLRPGYERFFTQAFDLVTAHLRLPRTTQSTIDPDTPPPLTILSQALIMVFKEAYPLARDHNKSDPQSLDATNIKLDNAYLRQAKLHKAWMVESSLRKADLRDADLRDANLSNTDLRDANLSNANLSNANLSNTDLRDADLNSANLNSANLNNANLEGAELSGADLNSATLLYANLNNATLIKARLNGAVLSGAQLINARLGKAILRNALLVKTRLCNAGLLGADLSDTNLDGADLSEAFLAFADLSRSQLIGAKCTKTNLQHAKLVNANLYRPFLSVLLPVAPEIIGFTRGGLTDLQEALSLEYTDLRGATGLTKEALAIYKARGAIVDEDSVPSTSAPPAPLQSNGLQPPLKPGSPSMPDTADFNDPQVAIQVSSGQTPLGSSNPGNTANQPDPDVNNEAP